MKTREEIDRLKESWAKDPCFDLESIEGFEDYQEELEAFRDEKIREWEQREMLRQQKMREAWLGMRVNERFTLDETTQILAVPGGWIVTQKFWENVTPDGVTLRAATSVFVPAN